MSFLHDPTPNLAARIGRNGFSLIEVLVALLILSIGLLGLAALQTTSLKYNTDSYTRTQATFFVYDIVDRMRMNSPAVATGGGYDVATTAAAQTIISSSYPNCETSSCNSASLAAYDLGKWYKKITAVLPGTTGSNLPTISVGAGKLVTITMRWQERGVAMSQQWVVQL